MGIKIKGPMTAAEFTALLQSDPESVREMAEADAARKAMLERERKAREPEVTPLLAELNAAGIRFFPTKIDQWESEGAITGPAPLPLDSISRLTNTLNNYAAAVPIMVKHLRTARDPVLISCLARGLTVKEAQGTEVPHVILEKLILTEPCPAKCGDAYQARWALANALVVAGDASVVEAIKGLLADSRYADLGDELKDALKHCERLAKRSSGSKRKAKE